MKQRLVVRTRYTNRMAFFATLVPMVLLLTKVKTLSKESRAEMRRFYANEFYLKHPQRMQIEIHKASKVTGRNYRIRSTVYEVSNAESWMNTHSKHIPKWGKIIILVFVALAFAAYGIVQITLVFGHFDYAEEYCHSTVDNLNLTAVNSANPELLLYDRCTFKVYPFSFGNNEAEICNCRQFEYEIKDNAMNQEMYFEAKNRAFSNVFKSWTMLEKVRWEKLDINDNEPFNLTKEMFGSEHMRVLELVMSNIGYIDDAISNWKKLEVLIIYQNTAGTAHNNIPPLPGSMKYLTKMQHFEVDPFSNTQKFPEFLCELHELKKIQLRLAADVISVPQCISNLQNLNYFWLEKATKLRYIPLSLFTSMPNLIDLNLAVTPSLSLDGLIEYNNLSDAESFDEVFSWNQNSSFWFQRSGLCVVRANSSVFDMFLSESQACQSPCDDEHENEQCLMTYWQNGECTPMYNNPNCHFDGGDCVQLCDFDECDYKLLGNGECNEECNTANCRYDEYDCVEFDNYNLCESTFEEHGCNSTWINDGWCDNNCRYVPECAYDGNDCEPPICGACSTLYTFFNLFANSITADDYISEQEVCYANHLNLLSARYRNHTCAEVLSLFDFDNDGMGSFDEAKIAFAEDTWISPQKAEQTDCSGCAAGTE